MEGAGGKDEKSKKARVCGHGYAGSGMDEVEVATVKTALVD